MKLPDKSSILIAGSLILACGSGILTAQALGINSAGTTRTITITIPAAIPGPKGDPGPQGPPGPKGDSGAQCPSGYTDGKVVFNTPGGHTDIWTCIHD